MNVVAADAVDLAEENRRLREQLEQKTRVAAKALAAQQRRVLEMEEYAADLAAANERVSQANASLAAALRVLEEKDRRLSEDPQRVEAEPLPLPPRVGHHHQAHAAPPGLLDDVDDRRDGGAVEVVERLEAQLERGAEVGRGGEAALQVREEDLVGLAGVALAAPREAHRRGIGPHRGVDAEVTGDEVFHRVHGRGPDPVTGWDGAVKRAPARRARCRAA